ncbi:glycosyltransferase family 2 protein [Schlesneria paludicola]|uniref:glycosyltransferase family 2 protein n=1 Tax=Schlesneria paludicola TaxID=360056 RepID=UPI00029A0A55|nr:glycosyltransferase family 2 protein [Schlesneria paludicola]
MSTPLVSIGMPVYNGGETLRRALKSVLAQSEGNFEIILSDNASTDGVTQAICEEYARLDPRIRLTRQPENRGAIANFLWVVEHARGKYFMWAAHDDTWAKDYVELLSRRLDACPTAVLATPSITTEKTISHGDRIQHVIPPAPNADRWTTLDVFIKDAGCEWIYGLYRTNWIKTATPQWVNFPLDYGDLVWMFDLMVREQVVGEPNTMFYYTNSHKTQKTANRRLRKIEVWAQLIYHLNRISWTRVPPAEQWRAFFYACRIIFRFHIYRRGILGTPANIAKLAMLWAMFGFGKGVNRIMGHRSLAR